MSEQLTNALAQLAAQLGTTVPYLWEVMVSGVTLRAASDMVGYSLFALVLAKAAMVELVNDMHGGNGQSKDGKNWYERRDELLAACERKEAGK